MARGKKGTAQLRVPKTRRRRPPDPKPPPLAPRKIGDVSIEELFDALVTSQTIAVVAYKLRVPVQRLVERLEEPDVDKALRQARMAAGIQMETRVAAAASLALDDLEYLAQSGTHLEGTRVFASRAILDFAARVMKADRAVPSGKRMDWGDPPPPFEPNIDQPPTDPSKLSPEARELLGLPAKGTA